MNKVLFALALGVAFVGLALADAEVPCGTPVVKPDENRLIGGHKARPYSWPWQGVMYYHGAFRCGGTVIDKNWIMTAGHCVHLFHPNPRDFKYRLGVYKRTSTTEPGEQVVTISEIHLHPNFTVFQPFGRVRHDIALLKTAQPIVFTDHIRPVCLPKDDNDVIKTTNKPIMTGWGSSNHGLPVELNQLKAPFVSYDECERKYPHSVQPDNMVCIGAIGKVECHGDSGGPAVFRPHNGTQWYQYGIVSWAHLCNQAQLPGVLGRVTSFCPFIKTTTGKDLCH